MKLLLTSILLISFFSFSVKTQKLKKKTQISGNTKEVFFIDKKTKLKNGLSYQINTKTKDTVAIGEYKNEMRIGKWKFADVNTGKKRMEYDFTNDSLMFLAKDCFPDSFLVNINNDYVVEKVDRPLLLIGMQNEIRNFIQKNIKMPSKVLTNKKSGTSLLSFKVDKNGTLKGGQIVQTFNNEIEQQVFRNVNYFSGRFLPAIVDNKPIGSMFFVKINITHGTSSELLSYQSPYITEINFQINSAPKTKRATGYQIRILTETELHNYYYNL